MNWMTLECLPVHHQCVLFFSFISAILCVTDNFLQDGHYRGITPDRVMGARCLAECYYMANH